MTVIVLTGAPGVGKTTIVMDMAQKLNERAVRVGGVASMEVRTNNVRTGFQFIDLTTNDREILASVTETGPRVGKYFVSLSGCQFAANRLNNALINSDVIICDEIGPMELKSKEFADAARNLITTHKNAIVVVHQKLDHPLANKFREKSSSLISITPGNRNEISKILLDRLNV